jgi:hypothetical protein
MVSFEVGQEYIRNQYPHRLFIVDEVAFSTVKFRIVNTVSGASFPHWYSWDSLRKIKTEFRLSPGNKVPEIDEYEIY